MALYMWDAKLYVLSGDTWERDRFDSGYCDEQYLRLSDERAKRALVRQRDGIVIACSRLTEAQTRALYAVIGRAEPEAA